ncbi:MAG TPA: sensor histidine kinase [Actinomycetota bacterium]|nr:sensor histidine kinase [Actinomycetota bacterium]
MNPSPARRLAWSLWALAIALGVVASVFLVLGWRTPLPAGTFGFRGFTLIFVVVFPTVGAVVASRRPGNPIGWMFLAVGVLSAVQELAQDYAVYAVLTEPGALPGGTVAAWVPAWIWVPATSLVAVFLFPIFPTGALPSRRWRVVPVIGAVGVIVASAGLALTRGPLENFSVLENPFGVLDVSGTPALVYLLGLPLYTAAALAGASSLVVRYRRAGGDERQQLKWLASSGLLVAVTLSLSFLTVGVGAQRGPQESPTSDALETLVILSFATVPVAVGIAILKHRLWDIDVVISKAVAVGLLAAFITLVYVGIVVGVGAAIGSRGNVLLSGVAAAVVAVAFQPVRRRAQRLANRLVYGERATPYEVLAEFSARLAGSYSLDDVLPRMARVLAEGTGAARVTIWLRTADAHRPAVTWPAGADPAPLDPAFEVRHQGELLGAISVAMPPNEPLTPTQEDLIRDVAAQAGLVLRNVRLIEDLRASRQRLVAAQDEERRRIERNIHDGAQQQLVALAVKARLADSLVGGDDERAHEILAELREEMGRALDDLRDLARGIYPPLLADEGLASALQAQARKAPVAVTVDADAVGRYPPEVEAAVYFCVLEALQNAAKYAPGSRVIVRLWPEDRELRFAVEDDGPGFDPNSTPLGAGLRNMADRLDALGGSLEIRSATGSGTVVEGRIPVRGDGG